MYSPKEIRWLDKFESRLIMRGISKEEARIIRNAIADIDLLSKPQTCADYEYEAWVELKGQHGQVYPVVR
jgi:hypothetical protein